MVSSTVFYTLIVLHLTSAIAAQWISCLNGCDQINNIQFSDKISSVSETGELVTSISQLNPDETEIWFQLNSPPFNSSDQTTSIEYSQAISYVLFTCSLLVTVKTGKNYVETITHYSIYPKINGTSIYINDQLYCSWSINMENNTFPYELIDPPQYFISKSGYQILYNLNQTVRLPVADYSQLPKSVEPFVDGYKYKAVGSQKYLLIARMGNQSTDFLLKVNAEIPKSVEVRLKSEIEMDIECNFEKQHVFGYINYGEKTIEWRLLRDTEINDDECRWSLPDLIDSEYGILRPKQMVHGVKIVENNKWVYFDENNFRIGTSGSSSLVIAKSLLIITILSVIFL